MRATRDDLFGPSQDGPLQISRPALQVAPPAFVRFTDAQLLLIDEEADHLSAWYAHKARHNPMDMTDGELGRFARIRAGVCGQAALKIYLGSPLEEIRSNGQYDGGVDELIVTRAGELWTAQVKTSTKRPLFYYRRSENYEHSATVLVQTHMIADDQVELLGWMMRTEYDRLEHPVPIGSKTYPGLELKYFAPMAELWALTDQGIDETLAAP